MHLIGVRVGAFGSLLVLAVFAFDTRAYTLLANIQSFTSFNRHTVCPPPFLYTCRVDGLFGRYALSSSRDVCM